MLKMRYFKLVILLQLLLFTSCSGQVYAETNDVNAQGYDNNGVDTESYYSMINELSAKTTAEQMVIRNKIRDNWTPPATKAQKNVKVWFFVDKTGEVSDYEIVESSNNKSVDESVLQAIKKSNPFPGSSTSFSGMSIELIFAYDDTPPSKDVISYSEIKSTAIPTQNQKPAMQTQIIGIGAELIVRNGRLMIADVLVNSPAENAGLRSGDFIIAINNRVTDGLSLSEATNKISGKENTIVHLSILREGNNIPIEYQVKRAKITDFNISTKTYTNNSPDQGYVYQNGKRYKEVYNNGTKRYYVEAPDMSSQNNLNNTVETINKGNQAVNQLLRTIKMYGYRF